MALLLAMYQKMRLVREKNQLVLEQAKYGSKIKRVQNNIKNVTKMFESRKSKLESQAKLMQNQAQSVFRQMSGLTMTQGAFTNPYQMGGQNAFINQQIQMLMGQKIPFYFDADGKMQRATNEDEYTTLGTDTQQALMYLYQTGQLNSLSKHEDDPTNYYYKDANGEEQSIAIQDYAMFQQIINQANQNYYTANNFLQTSTENYSNNVSIWLQAETERLEAEQDAALEPLNYQETMWELDKEQVEVRLKMVEAELESYTQLVDNEAKNMAPKFGL